MKKAIKPMTILALVALMLLSLVACGGGGSDKGGSYKTDDVKAKLASVFGIEESSISVNDRGATVIMSHGGDGVTLDAYVFEKAKDAPATFDLASTAGLYEDKRVDENNHKIWVQEYENWATGGSTYSVIAMKDNFILSCLSELEPETIINAFDLN